MYIEEATRAVKGPRNRRASLRLPVGKWPYHQADFPTQIAYLRSITSEETKQWQRLVYTKRCAPYARSDG